MLLWACACGRAVLLCACCCGCGRLGVRWCERACFVCLGMQLDDDDDDYDIDIAGLVSPVSVLSPTSSSGSSAVTSPSVAGSGSGATTPSGKAPGKAKGSAKAMLSRLRELVLQGIPTAYRAAVSPATPSH